MFRNPLTSHQVHLDGTDPFARSRFTTTTPTVAGAGPGPGRQLARSAALALSRKLDRVAVG